jgi:hypothetical protein
MRGRGRSRLEGPHAAWEVGGTAVLQVASGTWNRTTTRNHNQGHPMLKTSLAPRPRVGKIATRPIQNDLQRNL